jgi:hypothetical protein
MANDYDMKARNLGVDAIAAVCLRLALHTGDPGGADSASNEVAGGSPAYARKAVAWNAAGTPTPGAATQNGNVVFDVPSGTTVAWVSGWNTAGTSRYFKKQVTSEVFGAQGTYTVLASGSSLDLNDA